MNQSVDNSWLREETDKLVNFIKNAPAKELDEFLAAAKFGSLKHMTPLIQRVLNDEHLYPRVKTGEAKGKPVYKSTFEETEFYEENGAVYVNFTSSMGQLMRYKYEYKWFNTSAFCEKHNVPLNERPSTQPFDMLTIRTEFIS